MDDDKSLVECLRDRHKLMNLTGAARRKTTFSRAADAIERLARERDEARAALASARNDALEKAANVANECGRHNIANAIRAMKREPADD